MANITVNTENLRHVADEQMVIAKQILTIESRLRGVTTRIGNMNFSNLALIKKTLSDSGKNISSEQDKLLLLAKKLEEISLIYERTENNIRIKEGAGSNEKGLPTDSDSIAEDNQDNQFIAWLKAIFKIQDKTGYNDESGILGDGLSYIETLLKFFKSDLSGLSGIENCFDLGDKSIGLWKGFYDYLKDFYQGAGKTFSINNQYIAAKIGIVGGILGGIGGLCGAVDTINNTDNIGTAGVIGKILGVGDNVVDIGVDIEKMKNIGKSVDTRVYSPTMCYTTIAKSYLSAISQGFTSYDKYSADGVWDLKDTAATGLEASVSGLGTMIDTLTFGLVSERTTGISSEEVSECFSKLANNAGTRAGNYILNNSELHQKYENANGIGKVLITFYAAIVS